MPRNTNSEPPANAEVPSNSPSDASSKLYNLIKGRIEANVRFAGFSNQKTVKDTIFSQLEMVRTFWNDNKEGIVEAHMIFWAYRNKELLWKLKVVWDCDNPITTSVQTPHYGYEIYFNNERVGGAGHVWFKAGTFPPHWRLRGLKFSEEYSGVHIHQFDDFPNDCRLDVVMRYFKMGPPGEEDARKETEFSWQVLDRYPKPAFGKD